MSASAPKMTAWRVRSPAAAGFFSHSRFWRIQSTIHLYFASYLSQIRNKNSSLLKRTPVPCSYQAIRFLKQRGPTPMTRLFFDLVGPDDRSFDFHGRYFRDPKDAHEHAQLLSLDLSCTDLEKWHHAEVQVRDAFGIRLFSVPIIEIAELSAAA